MLEERDKILDTLIKYDDKFTVVMEKKGDAENTLSEFKKTLKELENELKKATPIETEKETTSE